MRTARGVLNIPVPRERHVLTPDVLVIPLIGFDRTYYRLGYGGGYYDRTLARASPRPFAIGIGYERVRLPSIKPQPHDVAMDAIVTEEGVVIERPSPTSG
jgi:5-formyltetrahydrofolate cyclo-ligase